MESIQIVLEELRKKGGFGSPDSLFFLLVGFSWGQISTSLLTTVFSPWLAAQSVLYSRQPNLLGPFPSLVYKIEVSICALIPEER